MQIQDRIKAFKRVPARDLIPNPKNWRKHPEAQQNAMRSVLADIGFADAVLARETPQGLMLIDGHLRAEIAPDCQMPVLVLDVTELEADKILATHDPLAAMADVDAAALSSLLEGFEIDCEELAKQLDDLVSSIDVDLPEVVEDEAPIDAAAELQTKWQTAEGQFWTIEGKAKHRLVCGDSTKQDVVAKCLHGSVPYLMVTDPPYGVEYDPQWRNEAGDALGKSNRREGTVSNDGQVDWSASYAHFPGAVAYVWHADRHASTVANNLTELSFEIRNQVIWRKASFAISRGHYHWQHEPCWYAVKRGQTANWCGDRSQSTVWDISPQQGDRENLSHGTMKPVECMARPIRNHSGDVYDPFLGSGTTMVAAEQLERRCFGIELEPKYVAVCLERMERLGCTCTLAE